jgi:hypothetical protein
MAEIAEMAEMAEIAETHDARPVPERIAGG